MKQEEKEEKILSTLQKKYGKCTEIKVEKRITNLKKKGSLYSHATMELVKSNKS